MACTQPRFESTASRRSRVYLSLSLRDFSTTDLRVSMERVFVPHAWLKSGRSSALKDFNLYWTDCPQTDLKRSGGWKAECTDWCFLRGVHQTQGFNCRNEKINASKYKEWRGFVFFLDGLLFVRWPDTLWENPFKTQFDSWLLGLSHKLVTLKITRQTLTVAIKKLTESQKQ